MPLYSLFTMLQLSVTLPWVISQSMLQDASRISVGIDNVVGWIFIFYFLFWFLCLVVSTNTAFPLSFMARRVSGRFNWKTVLIPTHTYIILLKSYFCSAWTKLKTEIGLHRKTCRHHRKQKFGMQSYFNQISINMK